MVTLSKYGDCPKRAWLELYGLAVDEKPIKVFEGICIGNASTYYEMDTKKCYIYDEENHRWLDM